MKDFWKMVGGLALLFVILLGILTGFVYVIVVLIP